MAKLNGWLIYNGHLQTNKFLDYVDWMLKAAEKQGIELAAKTNDQFIAGTTSAGYPAVYSRSGKQTELPDFIHFADKDLHLARQLERLGVHLFNSSTAIGICDNKSLMHEKLAAKQIPVPKTMIAPLIFPGMELINKTYLETVEREIGLPLIVKEAYGSFGEQVYWVENRHKLHEIAARLAGRDHLYQQPALLSVGTDIRLNVVGNEVVAAMKRTSENDFRANVTAGGSTQPYRPDNDEIQLALAAAKAVQANFAGVDLLYGENGPMVCEVNSNPHLRSIYECTGVDVADYMISFISNKLT
ncbi:ATP-grasp domain-containing protein [Salipaludibacillus aurantiacus]|uniref:Ribosomal protein S6--L-glutamate ligase/gamma-F420-2:alpha-L-glutamate ligase n=1 Tax=Salipaludibacillus aurantiacus TaxID=1601833 RepID=A0A1H9T4N2_9BACI|nr:RimK family alpha-L-glutamate ligase [Salipaludibacillus aurantiacus]SER92205.1 ribosomal protein S6--L-glutamate ligase/gamma-F420-2:alpha-L-glutamate ligase [Salipaludibacillus aurantiacus]